jgi:hypothetical protein
MIVIPYHRHRNVVFDRSWRRGHLLVDGGEQAARDERRQHDAQRR